MNVLDNSLILRLVFYPRPDHPGHSQLSNVYDGVIEVNEQIRLGYRCYVHRPESPLLVYFHGNATIASDLDAIAPSYRAAGVSLLVIEYRGFGWSTGKPLVSALLPDAEIGLAAIPKILGHIGITPEKWIVQGVSLGSVPAVHLARKYPERFRGLIVESGIATLPAFLNWPGLALALLSGCAFPFTNVTKMKAIHLPLLVIHGEADTLLPVRHGQRLYDVSPAMKKTLLRIPTAGHNDILAVAPEAYFRALAAFVQDTCQA